MADIPAWAQDPAPQQASVPAWARDNQQPVAAPAPRRPAATGLGAVGQTISDIFAGGAPLDHDPNAFEQGIMDLADSPVNRYVGARWRQNAVSGLFAQPTRAAMEALNYDRRPGETDAQFHARYSRALQLSRQQASQDQERAMNDAVGPRQNIESLITGKPAPLTLGQRATQLGMQGLGFATDIVANPQYFLVPGVGAGAGGGFMGAATRIGAAGGANALIGGASDSAAQLMDMAEGDQKEFDVNRALQSATLSGVFGAGAHGAIEAAPFVKSLFSARGVDTMPAADPRQSNITPLTQDHVPLNQADAIQYRQLLQHGSVDDIKGFFQGRNGSQPSWQEVNDWVEHRDNGPTVNGRPPSEDITRQPEFNYEQAYNDHAEQQWRAGNRQAVEDHVNNLTAGWKNSPGFEVVHGPEDIADPEVRASAIAEGAHDSLGFLGADGKVRLFSGRITDPDTATAVAYHEALGHGGLAAKFGDRLDQVITSLLDRNVNGLARDTDAWMKQNKGAYGGDRVRAAEEVLAERSQDGPLPKNWQDGVTSAVRQFGRKMGLKLAYSDAEVRNILAMAHDAVINGKPSAAANGFRGAKQDPNKFMFVGERSSRFNPNDPTVFRANDGQLRQEIDDSGAQLKTPKPQDNTLGDVLDHPELYSHYPELRDLPVEFNTGQGSSGNYYDSEMPFEHIGLARREISPMQRQIVMHEAQHAVQHIEERPDFMRVGEHGGTDAMTDEDYWNHPSEVEARATEDRRNMTMDERVANPPPKFITARQLAASKGYQAEDMEGIYKALDEGYKPETIPWEQTKAEALKAGFTPKMIEQMRKTNPGELSRNLWRLQSAANMADMRIRDLNEKLDTPAWSEGDRAEYIRTIADRNFLVTRIKGERAEIARALNVAKAAASYHTSSMEAVAEALRAHESGLANLLDNPDNFNKFARQVKNMMNQGNSVGAQNLLANVNKPYWEQYLTTYHMNMMLSALSTHVKAPIDMGTGIARNVIEKLLAIPVGKARNMFEVLTGRPVTPGVDTAELLNHVFGTIRAVTDGEVYRAMAHAVKTGEGSYVDANGQRVPSNFQNQFGSLSNPRILVISKPTDLISAQDTFFRSVEMNAQLYALGAREARVQLGPKATTSDVMTLGEHIAQNPTNTMLKEAYDLTNRTLLLNENPLNAMINKFRTYRPGMTRWQRVGAYITTNLAPFIRVESNNLINRIVQRSPLGFLDHYTMNEIRAGGARADLALTRIMYGTTLLGMYWVAAGKPGLLTGEGATNVDKYKADIAVGRVPQAVHENGTYNTGGELGMSVNPFDLHNKTAQIIADLRHSVEGAGTDPSEGTLQRLGTMTKVGVGSILHDLSEMSWVSDMAPFMDAMTAKGESAGQKVETFAGNEARTWSPNALNQVARMTDNQARDTNAPGSISGRMGNELMSTIPGLRQQLPVKYSIYGDPLQVTNSLTSVHTALSFIPGLAGNHTTESTDRTEMELDRLNNLDPKHTLVTPVSHSVPMFDENGDPVKDSEGRAVTRRLSPVEFEEYQRVAGRAIVETVRQEMASPEWGKMTDEQRREEVRSIQSDMKAAAREHLFGK